MIGLHGCLKRVKSSFLIRITKKNMLILFFKTEVVIIQCNFGNMYEKWIKTFTDKQGYPWHPFASYYERIVQGVVNQY